MSMRALVFVAILGISMPASAQFERLLDEATSYNGVLQIGDDGNHMCPYGHLAGVSISTPRGRTVPRFTVLDNNGNPIPPGVHAVGRGFRLTEKPSERTAYVLSCSD